MRIAVIVHNDVVKDSRIRKEVRTLVHDGHIVDVYGLSDTNKKKDYPESIEGSRLLEIVPYEMIVKASLFKGNFVRYAIFLIFVIIIFCMIAALSFYSSGFINVSFIKIFAFLSALCVVAVGAFLLFFRAQIIGLKAFLVHSAFALLKTFARRYRYNRLASLLVGRVSKRPYDVVHCHDIVALIAGAKLKRSNPDIKVIWDAHEMYDAVSGSTEREAQMVRSVISNNQEYVDRFITISDSFAAIYSKKYRLPPAVVVMNATMFSGTPTDDGRLRAAAGLDADRRIVLFQGGLAPERGLSILLAAVPRLPQPWSLVVMGWGPLETEIRMAIRALRSGHAAGRMPLALVPPAPQEDLQSWSSGADIGVIPYENTSLNHLLCTPNKLWEFPNAGVPILATDLVEMGRIITEWDTGFLLPRDFGPDDVIHFFSTLDLDELRRKKSNCLKFSQEMSWRRFEPRLRDVYASLA